MHFGTPCVDPLISSLMSFQLVWTKAGETTILWHRVLAPVPDTEKDAARAILRLEEHRKYFWL